MCLPREGVALEERIVWRIFLGPRGPQNLVGKEIAMHVAVEWLGLLG